MRYIVYAAIAAAFPLAVPAADLNFIPEEIDAGQAVYAKKCARCHGQNASGRGASNIQGIIVQDVKDAARCPGATEKRKRSQCI